MKHRDNEGETKGTVRKNKKGGIEHTKVVIGGMKSDEDCSIGGSEGEDDGAGKVAAVSGKGSGEVLRSKDLKVRLAQSNREWRRVFYPSIVEGDADR